MKTKLPEKVTMDTRDIYRAYIRFLKEYNNGRALDGQGEDWVDVIITEMENFQIVRSVWKDWETALTSILLETDVVKESDLVERELEYFDDEYTPKQYEN